MAHAREDQTMRRDRKLLALIMEHLLVKGVPAEIKQEFKNDQAKTTAWLVGQVKQCVQDGVDVRRLILETSLLKVVGIVMVPARTKPFSTAAFYQNGPDLNVNNSFADRLDLRARRTLDSAQERLYVASRLKPNAYDTDIRRGLPEVHLSLLEDIAGLIEAQPRGKSGILLNDGSKNIFYVKGKYGDVYAVGVSWGFGYGGLWVVHDYGLDEYGRWNADSQVLFPGNASL